MKLLITGATGFIGQTLVGELISQKIDISIAVRKKSKLFPSEIEQFVMGDFEINPNFYEIFSGVDCVIHLAGRAHVIDKTQASVLDEFRKSNTELTINLAQQASMAGVKRFIFLSSVRVNGNQNNYSFLETDTPNPQEDYAISKYEAEEGLLKLAKNSNLEVVIIRPPLVYGSNAPGNFGRLLKWVDAKFILPLPLGNVNNARSFVAIDNLVNFIFTCTIHPKAANEIFLISDNDIITTTQLVKNIAKAFNKKVILLPIPIRWMTFLAKLLGREADAVRLFSSLSVDISKARDLLGWYPISTMEEQLIKIAENEKII